MPSFPLGPYGTWQTPHARGTYFTKKTWLPWEALQAWLTLGTLWTLWAHNPTFPFGTRKTNGTWRAHRTWDSRQAWLSRGTPHSRGTYWSFFSSWSKRPRNAPYTPVSFGSWEAWLSDSWEAWGSRQPWQSLLSFATWKSWLARDPILARLSNSRHPRRSLNSWYSNRALWARFPRGPWLSQGTLGPRKARHSWFSNSWQSNWPRWTVHTWRTL